jgi:hypothetical protein
MTQRLGCEAADLFAAVAPVAFPIGLQPITACQPSRPIAVLTFQGLTDALVPYEGGGPFYSAAESFAHWRGANGCGDGAVESEVVQGASRCDTDTSCSAGVEVGLCSITSTFTLPIAAGHILYINADFDLAVLIWDFLSRFALPGEPPPLARGLAGKKLALKDDADPSKRKLALSVKDAALALDPALDPTAAGASFQLLNAGTGENVCLALPAGGWKRKGAGFVYKDEDGTAGPCQSAKLAAGKLEVACSGKHQALDYSLDEPAQGAVAARFASGPQAFCAAFGGNVRKDTSTAAGKAQFLAKSAPAPSPCPSAGAACP